MRTRIVRIGNSRGVRIPKPLLDRAALQGEVEIDAKPNRIVILSVRPPRAGWAEAFAKMARAGHDRLLDPDLHRPTEWETTEWEWR